MFDKDEMSEIKVINSVKFCKIINVAFDIVSLKNHI